MNNSVGWSSVGRGLEGRRHQRPEVRTGLSRDYFGVSVDRPVPLLQGSRHSLALPTELRSGELFTKNRRIIALKSGHPFEGVSRGGGGAARVAGLWRTTIGCQMLPIQGLFLVSSLDDLFHVAFEFISGI
jgi:hypothetical protein